MAGDTVRLVKGAQGGLSDGAVWLSDGTARVEAAPRGQIAQARHDTGNRPQERWDLLNVWDAGHETARIGMRWSVEDRRHRGLFDDLASVHHQDATTHLRDNAQVVGDEQHRHPQFNR